jgi:hypothetical protein
MSDERKECVGIVTLGYSTKLDFFSIFGYNEFFIFLGSIVIGGSQSA